MHWQTLYPEWVPALQALSQPSGLVMVIGGVDVGKSTFCSLLLRQWVAQGKPVGFLDLDLGQTTIGPPTTVSWTLITEPFERLSELEPGGLAFVGDTAPARHVALMLAGARHVLDELMLLQPAGVVVDTCGYISGVGGRHYKLLMVDLLRPRVIVAIQRNTELEPILQALRRRANWEIIELPVPQVIARKTPLLRAQHRRVAFAHYFASARQHTLSLDQVSLTGRRLGAGEPFSAQRLEYLSQQVRAELLHGERMANSVHIITRQPLDEARIQLLLDLTGVDELVLLPPNAYHHLLVGLIDYTGRHFGIGIIESLDFRGRTLSVLSPVNSVQPVRWVQLGYLRILPDGTELGEALREG